MSPNATRPLRAAWLIGLAAVLSACSAHVSAPPEPPTSVRRGDDLFRYEEYDPAIKAYRSYLDEVEQGDYTARVFYKVALAEYRLKRYHGTLKTLDELADRYPKGHWVQVEALRGDTERELGNSMMALQAWDKAWALGSDGDHEKLRQRVTGLSRHLNDVELARARRLVTTKGVGQLLDRQIASRQPPPIAEPMPPSREEEAPPEVAAAESEEPEEAEAPEPSLLEAEQHGAPQPAVQPSEPLPRAPRAQAAAASKARALQQPEIAAAAPQVMPPAAPEPPQAPPSIAAVPPAAPATTWPELAEEPAVRGTTKIGCLLPLSGDAREFGERSLRGVRLVFGDKNDRLVVKDTAGGPAAAVSAFEELSRDPTVLAVIGPLHSDDAQLVAAKAETAHVPVLLLSQRDGLAGHFVLQAGMTRGSQVGTLLSYAMDRVRLRRFGVLYPKDAYGAELSSTFRTAVEHRGGTVIGAAAYAPGTNGPESAAGTVKKWRDAANLQAVFLPDNAPTAAEFAKFLQRAMPDVTLLGVHGWEALGDHSAASLNGILFSDGFYAHSARPVTQAFVAQFQKTYGALPETLEAQAYDAALLAKRALDAAANSRSDFLRRLQDLGPVDGATGALYVTPQGLQRSLFLLQVYDGKLQEIGAAPAAEAPAETGSVGNHPPALALDAPAR
ncbi:MAG TPA: penicillin-binding protein activator [Candidatus Acidoferrales bacterium]|nr:penicillin-binding protein activator [Candidatus Acidoferrales bacterium]